MVTFCNVEDLDVVLKNWGKEIILHNDSDYCGKILRFKDGAKFSMHFHLKKHEIFFVIKGEFLFKFIDTDDATHHEKRIGKGSVIEINRGDPHQIIALTEGEILEISTQHFDDDSYRIEKGDSQL
jgi:mannose-6-phosphate isomerase-like protein (cupin superfamily)